MRRTVATVASLAILAAVMAWLAGMLSTTVPPGTEGPQAGPVSGRTLVVQAVTERRTEQAVGTVRARDETIVSARITARIEHIEVRAGDTVRRGDVLVRLDNAELVARVARQREAVSGARAALGEADPAYRRAQALFERGTVSRAELERAEAGLRTARAALSQAERAVEEAQAALGYATLISPLDARVVERYAEPGDTATPAMALLRLYNPASLRIEASVRESLATRLRVGDELTAEIDALDQQARVVVEEVVPSADPGSRTFLVRASLPTELALFPGMFARLLIDTGEVTRLYVPAEAITREGQLEFVQVSAPEGVSRRFVRTGKRADGRVEVLSGLVPGELIAIP